jgi:hypothetical protein
MLAASKCRWLGPLAAMLRVILNIVALLCVLGGLAGYLYWRRPHREVLFGAVFFSTWIYFIGFWMISGFLNQYSDDLSGGVIPYLAAAIPVVLFLGWFLRGTKVIKKK